MKYSTNPKLNSLLMIIEESLLAIYETPEESIDEIRHYYREFPKEPDYNLAQYGRLLVSSYQVRELMKSCGYKSVEKMNDDKVWGIYLRQVGYVVREIIKNNK